MRSRGKPEYQVRIAKERIRILLDEAKKASAREPVLAKRYTSLAKRIGMRYNVRLGKLKRAFCKHCHAYFTAENAQRRLRDGVITIKCFSCGKIMRIPYKPKKQL
ncbi:MAG: ribonuclease P [Candidatus Aenigmarchaeota archaeon]|nr:ribonuclease P [Candidatus Aenigmarchaeota archaeon]